MRVIISYCTLLCVVSYVYYCLLVYYAYYCYELFIYLNYFYYCSCSLLSLYWRQSDAQIHTFQRHCDYHPDQPMLARVASEWHRVLLQLLFLSAKIISCLARIKKINSAMYWGYLQLAYWLSIWKPAAAVHIDSSQCSADSPNSCKYQFGKGTRNVLLGATRSRGQRKKIKGIALQLNQYISVRLCKARVSDCEVDKQKVTDWLCQLFEI